MMVETGADRLASTLGAAGDELKAMAATNRAVASAILAAAHPPRDTGRLAGSLTAVGTDTAATVSSPLPYAPVQEAKRGFLKAAVRSSEPKVLSLYLTHVNKALAGVEGV